MKQWLTILLMVWATAMLQSAGEHHATACRAELRAAVLAPEDGQPALADDSPLLATSSSATRQLSGAGQISCKGIRYPAAITAALQHHDIANPHIHAPASENVGHDNCPLSLRGGGRYIYFLRRIVI